MRWNTEGAFVGRLTEPLPPRDNPDEDNRSLIFTTFLAAPILPSGPSYKEIKFSGNTEVGQNSGTIGHALDTFAHHVVVDSQKSVLFVDLQGSSRILT